MPDDAQQPRVSPWANWLPDFTPLFRAFRMSYKTSQLGCMLAAILLICFTGLVLDQLWPQSHRVAAITDGGRIADSELEAFVESNFDRSITQRFAATTDARHGPFAVMRDYAREIVAEVVSAVFSARLVTDAAGNPGLFAALLKLPAMFYWLIVTHWLYALLFTAFSLIILSILGGAAYRLAALYAAREDVVGFTDAIQFAGSKFLSFVFTPLMPLGIILGCAFLLFAGGAVLGFWGLDVIAGLLWFMALLGGLVITLLLIGALAGWPLWFPTIAAEGSDVFDAFSRSYSYVFQRPWRAAFYALISLIYGVICYFFVRFFAWLLFYVVHACVGRGMNLHSTTLANGQTTSKLNAIWKQPELSSRFWGTIDLSQLTSTAWLAGALIWLWTALVVMLVAAWVLSFFCSATTLIYLLLRRDVDGTDMEEIWLREEDELFDTPPTDTTGPSTAASAGSSTPLPIVEPQRKPPASPGADAPG